MTDAKRLPPPPSSGQPTPDVCLVLEGTYPFVSGGVSSWVHQLIRRLDHLTFGLVHVSPRRGHYGHGPRYDVPEHVLWLHEVGLQDTSVDAIGDARRAVKAVAGVRTHLAGLEAGDTWAFGAVVRALDDDAGEIAWQVLQTREGWQLLVDTYREEAPEESFCDFFWTWRFAFLPTLTMLSEDIPDARVYHSISTGYAGLLAAAARVRKGRPMLLTEHGIYTKERRIEIERSEWIPDWEPDEVAARDHERYFHRFWARQFQRISRICYDTADEVITLFEGNRERQVRDGLEPGTGLVVPNGIDLDVFGAAAPAPGPRPEERPFTIGFVGRVCPIKDVKTLVYAMRLVVDEIPDARLRIMGPWDEDPEYASQCRVLADALDLRLRLDFEGRVNVPAELPTIDVLALTSISEAQPLVILEAGAAGLPVVATDVGSCRELLFGRNAAERAFGPGGFVTPIATPEATAEALLELARNPDLGPRLGANLRRRVHTVYGQPRMIEAYREIYARHLGAREAVEA